jgi:hypothetical protein
MYGEADEAPGAVARGAVGSLPAVWLVALLLAGAVSGVVSVVILGMLVLAALAPPPPLAQWGVIEPEEWLLAVHDHSAAGDGTAGCALTGQRLVRFDDRAETSSVDLRGAKVDVVGQRVEVRGPGGASVRCPFPEGEDPGPFAAEVARSARTLAAPERPEAPAGAQGQGR